MRALMEAANGNSGGDKGENNVDEYMANRSKILSGAAAASAAVKRAETALKTPSSKQPPAQVDRKQAMAKISQTFGYGENPKEQRPNLVSAKERQVCTAVGQQLGQCLRN